MLLFKRWEARFDKSAGLPIWALPERQRAEPEQHGCCESIRLGTLFHKRHIRTSDEGFFETFKGNHTRKLRVDLDLRVSAWGTMGAAATVRYMIWYSFQFVKLDTRRKVVWLSIVQKCTELNEKHIKLCREPKRSLNIYTSGGHAHNARSQKRKSSTCLVTVKSLSSQWTEPLWSICHRMIASCVASARYAWTQLPYNEHPHTNYYSHYATIAVLSNE